MSPEEVKQETRKRSLQLQIGLFYTVLALVNITFFSVMILENQTDLLLINFKYQSDDLAETVLGQLAGIQISRAKDINYKMLKNNLAGYELTSFDVFDSQGDVWHHYPEDEKKKSFKISEEVLKKSSELNNQRALFHSRYLTDLNENDFSLDILLPLRGSQTQLYLIAHLNIRTIQERLVAIYYQIAGAVLWGVLFHVLFAVFIFRVIFHRVDVLKNASDQMAKGDFSARALWKRNKKRGHDEFDTLGNAFNTMAQNIQEKVETISLLNRQIQEELVIGKEVQELFLSPEHIIKPFQPALFYRPLREVSGDIYRYFRFQGGYHGVFFADASGHGVSAALITVITLLSLQEVISRQVSPEILMTELNRILTVRLDTTYYVTAVFLLFDSNGKLYATNCGHNTIFLLPRDSDKRIEIKSHGPPLGLMEESKYSLEGFSSVKGDRIVLYTDGLIETEGKDHEQFGLQRLFDCLEENRNANNQQLQKALKTKFTNFARDYKDDVTFMLLEIP